MPSMANITVKKADGTTDQIWTAVQASGGDKSPAIWRNLTVGSAPAYNPELRMTSRPNQDGTVRRIDVVMTWPQTAVGTDGVTRKLNVFSFTPSGVVVPQGMDSTNLGEAAAQSSNLLASALIKSCLSSGFAPQ